eukprot:CCRYP_018945-RA/>CCRYP_018945-RA protein AED:0.27 eAED:0.27 QI:205/1/1/1/0.5/0.33/3/2935/278
MFPTFVTLAFTISLYRNMTSVKAFTFHAIKPLHQQEHKESRAVLPTNSLQGNYVCPDNASCDRIQDRRDILQRGLSFGSLVAATLTAQVPIQSSAAARNVKSRTAGYNIQHTEAEWSDLLSPQQYFILRQGGTESPYSSILEGEERAGLYLCAACRTPLFDAKDKFHSGTGWPSFASTVMSSIDPNVSNVETEDVSPVQYQLAGAEVRCHTCGGHLGDVFADGFLFVGTPAFVTGKRYCIDGGALLFVPKDQKSIDQLQVLRGDLPPKSRHRNAVFPG